MTGKTATLYRMETPEHKCPYGLKSRHLLRSKGYTVEDNLLTSREAVDAFKAEHGVKTTPQTFIDGKRIGGYEALETHLGVAKAKKETTYTPVIALFSVSALLAFAVAWQSDTPIVSLHTVEYFIAIAMVLLGLQKLTNIEAFATMFLNYDLLARRWVPYGRIYPFAEAGAGLLMLAGSLIWLASPVALFIGTIGAVSVFRAVYIERRKLKCACMGGESRVPLGFISLTENLIMIAMAIWMPLRMYGVI
ncbi:glutaredoxin [Alkalicaulis satelles]|uniref:Methylamine utilization protein MauE n=1 Tax=Alkalicaulis satelles TaxID=2609175 RepID=A0A5M6ZKT3_9PROT|nr:MauE/DoxX family redox-associated membrane protein [Alkalicaulis satelles]KAA5805429.1 glutaredoxin [Alkalicaulis satelles]